MSNQLASRHIWKVVTAAVPEPPPSLFSNCLVTGQTIYVSGQHAGTASGAVGGDDVFKQSREAFHRVITLVNAAGGQASDIVKLTIYLTDMSRKMDVSQARREFFADPMPCSTLVGVNALAAPDLIVEIEAIAVVRTSNTCHPGDDI